VRVVGVGGGAEHGPGLVAVDGVPPTRPSSIACWPRWPTGGAVAAGSGSLGGLCVEMGGVWGVVRAACRVVCCGVLG